MSEINEQLLALKKCVIGLEIELRFQKCRNDIMLSLLSEKIQSFNEEYQQRLFSDYQNLLEKDPLVSQYYAADDERVVSLTDN